MRRVLFYLNLIVFLVVWLAINGYTLVSLIDQSQPYTLSYFVTFLLILDGLSLPLIWLWYTSRKKTVQLQTAVCVAAVIVVFFWGPFSLVEEFFSLRLDSLQLKWLSFAYIWEVVIIGALVAYVVLRTTRLADRFLKGQVQPQNQQELTLLHQRIAAIPFKAAIAFAIMVFVGFAVGSGQFYYFGRYPTSEIVKNLINGLLQGSLSAFAIFFFLERIIDPALKKSGGLIGQAPFRKTSSLFKKVYAVSALLGFISAGFFLSMSYARGQAILEDNVTQLSLRELGTMAGQLLASGKGVAQPLVNERLGRRATIFLLSRSYPGNSLVFPGTITISQEAKNYFQRPDIIQDSFVDREYEVKIISLVPLNQGSFLASVVYLSDFDHSLSLMVQYSLVLLLVVIFIVATVATLFARSITLPILEIKEGGRRIGQGDFSAINVYTNDELEDLSHALDEASGQLKASYRYLEQEIQARTKELAVANQQQQAQIKELDNTSKLLVKRDQELQAANKALTELDQAKTQFVSVAAHQLRTPLSVSKWTFQMLLSGDFGNLTNEQQEVVKRGDQMNEQMIDLVSDLLDVARIESGKFAYTFAPIDIASLFSELQALYAQKTAEKQIHFALEIPQKGEWFVNGDVAKLRMVFQNLLDNAFKFTPASGTVSLKFTPKEEGIAFFISDSGIGISKEEIPRLFTKFFRARNAVAMDTRGTGLGLYIALSVVHAHHGTIAIDSELGKGTTFSIVLPKASAPASLVNTAPIPG